MGLSIKTCYTVKIQKQLDATQDKTTEKLNIARKRAVDSRLMRQTSLICLEALKFCVSVISEEWDTIMGVESKLRKRLIDTLVIGQKQQHRSIRSLISNFRRCLVIPEERL